MSLCLVVLFAVLYLPSLGFGYRGLCVITGMHLVGVLLNYPASQTDCFELDPALEGRCQGTQVVLENFPDQPVYLATSSDPEPLRAWGRDDRHVEETAGEELFFAIRRSP